MGRRTWSFGASRGGCGRKDRELKFAVYVLSKSIARSVLRMNLSEDGLRHAHTTVLSPLFGSFYTLYISLILCLYTADFPARSNLASLSPGPPLHYLPHALPLSELSLAVQVWDCWNMSGINLEVGGWVMKR